MTSRKSTRWPKGSRSRARCSSGCARTCKAFRCPRRSGRSNSRCRCSKALSDSQYIRRMDADLSSARPPLTQLSEEELMFRDAVASFAEEEVRPRVKQMEDAGQLDRQLIDNCFELGLMGIEVPEALGGAGGSLFMVALAVEEISKVDASSAILVDVQNTLVNYPINRYGSDHIRQTYLPRLTDGTVGAYALSE